MTEAMSIGVTGVGSLPHVDETAAWDFVSHHSKDLQFLPQLPQLDTRRSMLQELFRGLSDEQLKDSFSVYSPVSLQFRHFPEIKVFLPAVVANSNVSGALKISCVGPATFIRCTQSAETQALQEQLFRAYLSWLDGFVRSMQQSFPFADIWFSLDEPMLFLEDESDARFFGMLQDALQLVRGNVARSGVHTCGALLPEWWDLSADFLSFPFTNADQIKDIGCYYERGGICLFGVGHAYENELFPGIEKLLRQLQQQRVESFFLTTSCGYGLVRVEQTERSFQQLHALAQLLRD